MRARKNTVGRTLRGGGYRNGTWILRLPYRDERVPEERLRSYGFRFVVRGKK